MAGRARTGSSSTRGSLSDATRAILLTGDEAFLRDRRMADLESRFAPTENREYNVDVHSGQDVDLDEVVGSCDTLPMFASRRLVIVRELDLQLAAAHKRFIAYLERPNPTTVLVVTSGPSRVKRAAGERPGLISVKSLQGLFEVVEENAALTPDRAQQFVRDAAIARGAAIAPSAVRDLVELVGVDAGRLDSEVEKAVIYAAGRRIESADVELLAWRTRTHTMFELTDAIAVGDRAAVLQHLGALFEDGNDALPILGMVGWHLRRTLRAAAHLEAGASPREVQSAVGLGYGIADRFIATCRRLGTRGASAAILALQEADLRIKSTPEDSRQIVERTLLGVLPSGGAVSRGSRR